MSSSSGREVRHSRSPVRLLNVSNVTLRLRQGEAFYDCEISQIARSTSRSSTAIVGSAGAVLPKWKAAGFLYLDSSDADKDASLNAPGEEKKAQALLLRYLEEIFQPVYRFNGLIIGELQSAERILLRLVGSAVEVSLSVALRDSIVASIG